MKEPKFTPGPLIVCPAYADNGALSHYELRRKETGELVVEVGDPDAMINKTEKIEKANVTLYAAAPEMYEFGETTAEVLQLLLDRLGPTASGLNAEIKRLAEERIAEWKKIEKKAGGGND